MRRIIPPSVAVTLAYLGFDLLLDASGARTLISTTAPVVQAFLPAIGLGLVTAAALMMRWSVQQWGAGHSKQIICDLADYADALDMITKPGPHANQRGHITACVIGEKYRRWLHVERPDGLSTPTGAMPGRAYYIIQVFHRHGYFRGRYELRKLLQTLPDLEEDD